MWKSLCKLDDASAVNQVVEKRIVWGPMVAHWSAHGWRFKKAERFDDVVPVKLNPAGQATTP